MDLKTSLRVWIAVITGMLMQVYLVMPWLALPRDRGWSLRFYFQITAGILTAALGRRIWLLTSIGFVAGQILGNTIDILKYPRVHKFFLLEYPLDLLYGSITTATAFGAWLLILLIRRLGRGD